MNMMDPYSQYNLKKKKKLLLMWGGRFELWFSL